MEFVTKFIGASWTVRIAMIASAIVYFDPVVWLQEHPQFVEWMPDNIENIFLKGVLYISMAAVVYQRSKTKTATTWNWNKADDKEVIKVAEKPPLTPAAAEALRKQLAAFDSKPR